MKKHFFKFINHSKYYLYNYVCECARELLDIFDVN